MGQVLRRVAVLALSVVLTALNTAAEEKPAVGLLGDLAFLHVHPEEEHGAPNEIVFNATFPTAGRYRLYLQFKHEGVVQTAEFTVEVAR